MLRVFKSAVLRIWPGGCARRRAGLIASSGSFLAAVPVLVLAARLKLECPQPRGSETNELDPASGGRSSRAGKGVAVVLDCQIVLRDVGRDGRTGVCSGSLGAAVTLTGPG
jgi:hypothetical protein